MVSADLPGSKAAHIESVAKELPKKAKNKVKRFAQSMFHNKRIISKLASGSKKLTEDAQGTTTTSVEQKPRGIRRIKSDSLKAKDSIKRLFRSNRSKKQEGLQAAANLKSANDDSASETSTKRDTQLENTDRFDTVICNEQLKGVDIEKLPLSLAADPLALVSISTLESLSYNDSLESSMATNAEFLKSVDAALLYGQVDYEASGMPAINFAAVIYGDEGFCIAAAEPNKASEPTTDKVPFSSTNTAYTQSYVPTRQRALLNVSSSSQNSSVRTIVFSFLQIDDDSDQSSVTDSLDDEMNYISVKLPRTRIFKKKPKAYTKCRVRTFMPDLYGADCADVHTMREAAPVRLLTDCEILQPDTKRSGSVDFSELISKIDDLVSEQPVTNSASGIADILLDNVMAIDGEDSVAPLRRSSKAQPKCNKECATGEIDVSAETCHHQLYMSDEWTATEELFYEIEHLTTFTASSQSLLVNAGDAADTVAVTEENFAQFVAAIERSFAFGDHNAFEEADTLINALYGYQQVFRHLIKNVIAPGNERFHKLLKDFLYLRSSEGELVLEAERISHKLKQLDEEQVSLGSNFQLKVSLLLSSFRRVEGRFQRCQSELAKLQKEFSKEIPSVLEFISKLGSVRARVLDAWNVLHKMSDSADLFESYDILNSIHKEEFENMTSWHSTAAIGEIAHLLVKDLAILVDCNTMLLKMLLVLRKTVDTAERDMLIPCLS